MSITELTGLLGALVAVLTSVLLPLAVKRHEARRVARGEDLVSWQGLTKALQDERDLLRAELRSIDDDYRDRLRAREDDYRRQLAAARARIAYLERQLPAPPSS